MKILITGASGFLGKEIINKISNYEYISIGRSLSDIIWDLSTTPVPNIPLIDVVIHAAGKAHVTPNSIYESQLFYDVNYKGTVNLLKSLDELPILPKCFVFISSVAVYGMQEGINIDETTTLQATDSYGKSKIQAELIIKNWCLSNNVICTILRLPLLVGSDPPGNLGMMINAIKTGYYFNISGGSAKKSMVLAFDVSNCILKAAEVGGTYNLTDGYHPSFSELSLNIARQFGKRFIFNMPMLLAKILAFVGDIIGNYFPINSDKLIKITSTLTFDDSKARKAFGWNPTPVLKGFKIK